MKNKIVAALCISMLSTSLIMSGCSSNKQEKEPETKTETVKEEEQLKTIGEKTENAYEVTLKNSTTKEITGVSIKLTDDEKYPDNMLKDSDTFKKDESRILYYAKTDAADTKDTDTKDQDSKDSSKDSSAESSSDEKVLEEGYDIQITFADKTTAELHSFPFGDIEEGEILYADDVAYISYTSVKTKEKMDTKDAELAVKEQKKKAEEEKKKAAEEAAAKKKAEEEAAAKKAAEEAAAAQAAEEAAQQDTYDEPEQQWEEEVQEPEPVQEEPQEDWGGDQSTDSDDGGSDGCIDDGLVY